ncbi:hypothetical protein CRV24_005259 [Beauveria bassiana]|nr:hypothetical protein CRV24_005259 [Beauveria bassiana]
MRSESTTKLLPSTKPLENDSRGQPSSGYVFVCQHVPAANLPPRRARMRPVCHNHSINKATTTSECICSEVRCAGRKGSATREEVQRLGWALFDYPSPFARLPCLNSTSMHA